MAHEPRDEPADDRQAMNGLRARWVRRDLVTNGIVSVIIGIVALALMPPHGLDWTLGVQVTVAAAIAIAAYAVMFLLLVVPEILQRLRHSRDA